MLNRVSVPFEQTHKDVKEPIIDSRLVPGASGSSDLGVVVKDLEQSGNLTTVGAGTLEITRTARVDLGLGVGEGRVLTSGCTIGTELAEVIVERVNDRAGLLDM